MSDFSEIKRLALHCMPQDVPATLARIVRICIDAERQDAPAPIGTPAALWRAEGKPDPHGTDYDRERARLAHGDMSDDQIANAVYLDPSIGHLTAAKDRIRWLSRRLVEASSATGNEKDRRN